MPRDFKNRKRGKWFWFIWDLLFGKKEEPRKPTKRDKMRKEQ